MTLAPSMYAYVKREAANDWHVYVTPFGYLSPECVSVHTTANGARAAARRLNR